MIIYNKLPFLAYKNILVITFYNKEKRRKYHILKCQHWTVMLLLTHTIIVTCFNEIFVQKWQYLEICNSFLPYHFFNTQCQPRYWFFFTNGYLSLNRDADLSLFRPPFCFPVAADTWKCNFWCQIFSDHTI
jgi:hypothetical protein